MKIRFTKDGFFGIKAGNEFEVHRQHTPFVKVTYNGTQHLVQLTDIDGWYEVVRWKPEIGRGYGYVNSSGFADYKQWENSEEDNIRWSLGNCDQDNVGGRERTKTKAEKIRAIFKEGE